MSDHDQAVDPGGVSIVLLCVCEHGPTTRWADRQIIPREGWGFTAEQRKFQQDAEKTQEATGALL